MGFVLPKPPIESFLDKGRGGGAGVGSVTSGKVSHGAAGVAFGCDAAASLRNGPGVPRCPNSNVAAASPHFSTTKFITNSF